jgi:hypothetical protein
MLKTKPSVQLWKQGNNLPTQRVVGFSNTYMMNPKLSKAIQKSNLSYLNGLSIKQEIGKKVASKINLEEQGVVDQPTDNRTLSERQNDESNIQSQFLKVSLDLVKKDQPEAYKLMRLIKQRDNKAFIQVSPMIKKELEKYAFVDASLINNIFNMLKVRAKNKIFDTATEVDSQTGLETRVNKEAFPIQDSVQEANLVEPSLNDLKNDELNKDFEDIDIAGRNLEFLEQRSQRIVDDEERMRQAIEERRLAEEQERRRVEDLQRRLAEEKERRRVKEEQRRLAEEQERLRVEEEQKRIADKNASVQQLATPTKEDTENFVPETPKKRRNKPKKLDIIMEESPSQDKLMPQMDIKKVTFTESGLMDYSLDELKSIYTSLTGKTSYATNVVRLRSRILSEYNKNNKKPSQNEIFSRRDEGEPLKGKSLEETPIEGRGLKKPKKKKISQPFIHFV